MAGGSRTDALDGTAGSSTRRAWVPSTTMTCAAWAGAAARMPAASASARMSLIRGISVQTEMVAEGCGHAGVLHDLSHYPPPRVPRRDPAAARRRAAGLVRRGTRRHAELAAGPQDRVLA